MARKSKSVPEKPGSSKGPRPSKSEPLAGPSTNPATNLLLADIVMRIGTSALRGIVERRFLKGRYGRDTAKEIVNNRSIKKTLATIAVAKLATRSAPGAAVVGGGLLVKTLWDRSQRRRDAKRAGDQALLEQAKTGETDKNGKTGA